MSAIGPVGPERIPGASDVSRIENDPNAALKGRQFKDYGDLVDYYIRCNQQRWQPPPPFDAVRADIAKFQEEYAKDPQKAMAGMKRLVDDINKRFEVDGNPIGDFSPIVPGMTDEEVRDAMLSRLDTLRSVVLESGNGGVPREIGNALNKKLNDLWKGLRSGTITPHAAWEGYSDVAASLREESGKTGVVYSGDPGSWPGD